LHSLLDAHSRAIHNEISLILPPCLRPAESLPMLKKTELAEFKHLLLTLRSRIRGDVQHMQDEALDRPDNGGEGKSPTHLAELGTETYEQDFALRRVENEQEVLEEIDEALRRVDSGAYGVCLACQEQGKTPAKSVIPKARLRVIPYARNCVDCERKREDEL
jgi:DnaK suppressor protein